MNSSARVEEDPVPGPIQRAERWRRYGEILRAEAPEEFEKLLELVAAKSVKALEERREELERSLPLITESYFLT